MTTDSRVVRESPLAFGLCVIVCTVVAAIAIWLVLDFKYSTQIATGNNLTSYLSRQLDDSQKALQLVRPQGQLTGFPSQPINNAGDKRNTFSPYAGCQYIGGTPYRITAFHNYSRAEIVSTANEIAFKLERMELDRAQNLLKASAVTGGATEEENIKKRLQNIDEEENKSRIAFQSILPTYVRPMWDELHTRLKQKYPTSEDDGVSTDAMLAYCTGIVQGENPLTGLASYLRAMSARLPS